MNETDILIGVLKEALDKRNNLCGAMSWEFTKPGDDIEAVYARCDKWNKGAIARYEREKLVIEVVIAGLTK